MQQTQFDLILFARLGLAFTLALVLLNPDIALASTSSSSGLPWETPLQSIQQSLTGPVAYAVSLIGVVVTGAMLIFGGEINEFARRIIMLVLVIALLVSATNVLSTLFSTGAMLS
ncbi:MAG: TrbC/VirB2 family protein [Rhodomicrobium sp.]